MFIMPKISVVMITYGHEKFIRESIEGVLMQEGNFELELIIANDCSPDATDEIISEILKTHPKAGIISYFKHPNNIGMMANFIFALEQASGDYIALCEGDDYWTVKHKLQKQVDFLASNPEYVLCFHNAEIYNVTNNKKSLFVNEYHVSDYNAKDIFDTWLIPTASMVFKNVLDKKLPEFIIKATHGDLAIQVYLNEFGKFYAFNDVMSVYRINESSVTVNSFSSLKHNNAHVEQLKLMNSFFKKKYNNQIKKRIFLYYLRNANLYKAESIVAPLYWILKAISLGPFCLFNYRKQFTNSIKIVLYTVRVFLKLKKR